MQESNNFPSSTFDLEKHLHAQYSSNSNAHLKIFITFLTSLFVLFGTFGIVFAKTVACTCNHPCFCAENPCVYSRDNFLLLSMVVVGIFCLLTCMSVFFGYSERRDQIQLFHIREKYGLHTVYSTPFGRKINYFLTGYYRLFFIGLFLSQISVIVAAIYKNCQFKPNCCSIITCISYIFFALCIMFTICYTIKYYMNYKRIESKLGERQTQNCNVQYEKRKCTCFNKKISYVIISNGDFAVYGKKAENGDILLERKDLDGKFRVEDVNRIEGVGVKSAECYCYLYDKKTYRFWFWLIELIVVFGVLFVLHCLFYFFG